MHKNVIIVCDAYTRFEGEALATEVRKELDIGAALTFWSNTDAGSLSDTFVKIKTVKDAFVFLCISTDPVFKKIKVGSYTEEIKNMCKNIQSIGCTPVFCFGYYDTDSEFRKKKLRHLEKTTIKMCMDEDIYFLRVNLLSKDDYFFVKEGKKNLCSKISYFCRTRLSKNKSEIIVGNRSPKEVAKTRDGALVIRKAKKVVT